MTLVADPRSPILLHQLGDVLPRRSIYLRNVRGTVHRGGPDSSLVPRRGGDGGASDRRVVPGTDDDVPDDPEETLAPPSGPAPVQSRFTKPSKTAAALSSPMPALTLPPPAVAPAKRATMPARSPYVAPRPTSPEEYYEPATSPQPPSESPPSSPDSPPRQLPMIGTHSDWDLVSTLSGLEPMHSPLRPRPPSPPPGPPIVAPPSGGLARRRPRLLLEDSPGGGGSTRLPIGPVRSGRGDTTGSGQRDTYRTPAGGVVGAFAAHRARAALQDYAASAAERLLHPPPDKMDVDEKEEEKKEKPEKLTVGRVRVPDPFDQLTAVLAEKAKTQGSKVLDLAKARAKAEGTKVLELAKAKGTELATQAGQHIAGKAKAAANKGFDKVKAAALEHGSKVGQQVLGHADRVGQEVLGRAGKFVDKAGNVLSKGIERGAGHVESFLNKAGTAAAGYLGRLFGGGSNSVVGKPAGRTAGAVTMPYPRKAIEAAPNMALERRAGGSLADRRSPAGPIRNGRGSHPYTAGRSRY